MISHQISRDDVLDIAESYDWNIDKTRALRTHMNQLSTLLDRYYCGYANYMAKEADQLFDHQRGGKGRTCPLSMQVYIESWLECIESIPLRKDLGFGPDHHLVAVHYYCTDPDKREYHTLEAIAKLLICSKSKIHTLLQGSNYKTIHWPEGKPGINDYLLACEKHITAKVQPVNK